jgi:hypothetical protein
VNLREILLLYMAAGGVVIAVAVITAPEITIVLVHLDHVASVITATETVSFCGRMKSWRFDKKGAAIYVAFVEVS